MQHSKLTRSSRALGLALGLAAAPAIAAPAGPLARDPVLAVLPPRLVGVRSPALTRALADPIAAELHAGLRRGQLRLLELADTRRVAAGTCEDTACLRRLRVSLGATLALRSTITAQGRDYTLTIELVDTLTDAVTLTRAASCELCGLTELRALAAGEAARLLGEVAVAERAAPLLVLTSLPTGAVVTVDDVPVGLTPLELPLAEGQRVLRLRLDGHFSEERAVVAVAGVEERVAVTLRRIPAPVDRRGAGFGLVLGGLTAAMAGATLLAVDGQPRPRLCADAASEPSGHCGHRFDTDWAGTLALGVGAILTTTGIMILARQRRSAAAQRLRAGVGPTGFGLSGQF